MELPSLRRLSLAELDDSNLLGLIKHGESLFVERKRQPPPAPKFGAAIASFANSLGGWVLLGVSDDGEVVGFDFDERTDVQSHLANQLRKEVDPLPPFVAERRQVNGKPVIVIRVFQSADSPHIVTGTGAVYTRTSTGKMPVEDQATLLQIARRGEEAAAAASDRVNTKGIPGRDFPQLQQTGFVRVEARAAQFTVTPQFGEWAISSSAANWLQEWAGNSARVTPEARGAVAQVGNSHEFAVDSGGQVSVIVQESRSVGIEMHELRRDFVRPCLDFVASAFEVSEAIGRAIFSIWLSFHKAPLLIGVDQLTSATKHVSGEVSIPFSVEEREQEGLRIEREIARSFGIPAWEGSDWRPQVGGR